ncbi:MAG TPA: thioesterase family protein [Planctomycetota bacterium]|nr:thioesterase family protein [Planctomycetota bacterium]
MRTFDYRHVVCFQETNVVGNVYFAHHLAWQGRCRESFLRERCPTVASAVAGGSLFLATRHASCRYHHEVAAFDEIVVGMALIDLRLNELTLGFVYRRGDETVAVGEQGIACLVRRPDPVSGRAIAEPVPVPDALLEALRPYRQELRHGR